MLYLRLSNQIANSVCMITAVHQHTISSIRSQKIPTLPEELYSTEKGSEAEQQPILQELNVVSTNKTCTFVACKIK